MSDSDWTAMGKPKPWPDFPDGIDPHALMADREAALHGVLDDVAPFTAEDFDRAQEALTPGPFEQALDRQLEEERKAVVDEVVDAITSDPSGLAFFDLMAERSDPTRFTG